CQRQRGVEIRSPFALGLAGAAEDQIEVDVQADRTRGRDGGLDVSGLVRATERCEGARGKGLRAERYPGRTEGAPGLEPCAVERRGVRLERDLLGREVEGLADLPRQGPDLMRLEQARRSAAEEGGRDAGPAEGLAVACDIAPERGEIASSQDAGRRRGREVAVRTPRRAERDVDVQADRGVAGGDRRARALPERSRRAPERGAAEGKE